MSCNFFLFFFFIFCFVQVLNIRKLLTEVLLTVTNEEVKKIAQETYNEALRGTFLVVLFAVWLTNDVVFF